MAAKRKPKSNGETARSQVSKPVVRPFTVVLVDAARELGHSQRSLGELVGAERKTVGRWMAGRSLPTPTTVEKIAERLVPTNRPLAIELVSAFNVGALPDYRANVERFHEPVVERLVEPPPAPPASHLIDAVVYAACEAANATPATLRAPLRAAFARAHELGLSPDDVAKALEEKLSAQA